MRQPLIFSAIFVASILVPSGFAGNEIGPDPGPMVRALWLVQRYGIPEATGPKNDQSMKAILAKAMKDSVLTSKEMEGLMDSSTFQTLAGSDGRLDEAEIRQEAGIFLCDTRGSAKTYPNVQVSDAPFDPRTATEARSEWFGHRERVANQKDPSLQGLAASVPASRERLLPRVRAHADLLTTSFDMIDEKHREGGAEFAAWLASNYKPGKPLHAIVVCTGNSRRSILGATMGNIAAAYCGMPEVQFHSGGTTPSAFNKRTVAALKEIGIEVEPTGKETLRGEAKTANPYYRIAWGTPGKTDAQAMDLVEFSKHYANPANPQNGFAALLVCSEADEACPSVKGAAIRISMPYLDPKLYDESPFEAAKYAERRDDIGRLMLSTFLQGLQSYERTSSKP